MSPYRGRKTIWISGAVLLAVILISSFALLNARITAWVCGDGFRQMLDHETSKGLKLQGTYSNLVRTSLFGMHGDSFTGTQGQRTIVALQAFDITGTFNPLGVALKRWQLDNLHIKSGYVMLQKTEAKPGEPKGYAPIPWWGLFWPYKVYLTDVKVDYANILWQLNGKESGIYSTLLEITPNGRDFEYDAKGGILATPLTPNLLVRHAHMLIRKPRLYCPEFLMGDDDAHPEQNIRLEGEAGLQDDRSIQLKIDINSINVSPWLPETLRTHVLGNASGHFEYTSTGTGLETANGHGHLTLANGVLHQLPQVHRYATTTGSPDPGDLPLKVCQADVKWQQGAITVENLNVESDEVFRLEGTVTMTKDKALSGQLELGLTDPYLRWLPRAKEDIFTREEGPYHFATVNISGTSEKPQQDLSARVVKEIEKSPLTALKLFFNQAANWFNF